METFEVDCKIMTSRATFYSRIASAYQTVILRNFSIREMLFSMPFAFNFIYELSRDVPFLCVRYEEGELDS
jgi:hypothetical protein